MRSESEKHDHSLKLVKKYLDLKDINEARLWLGWGNIEYLLSLHEKEMQKNR